MTTILFLAADPTDASRLRLGEEVREIQEKLQLAKLGDNFVLHQRFSVRPADVSQALLDLSPQIVHFSGHGTDTGAICVEDSLGKKHPIQAEDLAALFEQFSSHVICVVLNACYSETQARAIARYIDYVIGMNQPIGDKAAIAFSIGFYQALGAGRSIEEAYKLGCVQIRLQGIPEHLTPVLISKKDILSKDTGIRKSQSFYLGFLIAQLTYFAVMKKQGAPVGDTIDQACELCRDIASSLKIQFSGIPDQLVSSQPPIELEKLPTASAASFKVGYSVGIGFFSQIILIAAGASKPSNEWQNHLNRARSFLHEADLRDNFLHPVEKFWDRVVNQSRGGKATDATHVANEMLQIVNTLKEQISG